MFSIWHKPPLPYLHGGKNLKDMKDLTLLQIMNSGGMNSVDIFSDNVPMNNMVS